MRPYLVPLLPTFHGMENENPYTHIRDFKEVCITFKEGATDMDLLKLKAFPLISRIKPKYGLIHCDQGPLDVGQSCRQSF